jgi:lipoyl(octanoyl) transferase
MDNNQDPRMDVRPATWRLITTPPGQGAWNMAVDESLLEFATRRASPPILRLYGWNPPCLSLGYAQPAADVDQQALAEHGWQLVRRPTGGRAILHTDELTYAVIAPDDEPRLRGNLLESYQRLSQALLYALQLLELPAQADGSLANLADIKSPNPVCFEVPSNYEITAGGKKLIGSAQSRRLGGVLQHGTLPLSGDLARITQALHFPSETERARAAHKLLARATTVEAVLGRSITWESASACFVEAFREVLKLDFVSEQLTPAESARADALVAEKYGHRDWTHRL